MTVKRILLVQPEQVARERLSQLLVQNDYSVVHANNGAEALALFKSRRFDLVITDQAVSFLSGAELAAEMKRSFSCPPVIMLSCIWQKPGPANPVDASLHLDCRPERLLQVMGELLRQDEQTHMSPEQILDSAVAVEEAPSLT